MKKYLIYLTKSSEVAGRLGKSFEAEKDGIESVASGAAADSDVIPAIYLKRGYFYCVVTYSEESGEPEYRLVIA